MSQAGVRGRGAPAPVVALLLALVTALVAVGPFGLRTAAAADPDQLVSITVTSLTPSLLTARDDDTSVRITGVITNTTDRPLVRVQAMFWRSLDPITDAEGLDHALGSAATDPYGRRIDNPDSYDETWTDDQQELAPGKSVPFTVQATLAELQLPATDGVYLIGVHVREDRTTTIGRARLFMPVAAGEPRNEVKMASLVLLGSRPSLLAPARPATEDQPAVPATFADDHLATDVADGGRLDLLLTDADQDASSFAVDPDLIASLQAMRDGYQVQSTEGAVTTGTGAAAAGRWLQRFTQVQERRDGYRLPYASLDLASLTHARQQSVIEATEQATAQVTAVADLPLLAQPTNGQADDATLQATAVLSPAAYLLSDSATGGRAPLLQGPGGHPIVAYSASSTTGGPGPTPSTTPTHQRQAFLATSWIEQATAEPGTSLGSVRVIAKPEDAGPPVADAPWLKRTTLADLLAGTPSEAPEQLSYPTTAAAAELTAEQLRDVADLSRYGNRYAGLVTTNGASARAAAATARAASGAWRGEADGSHAVVRHQLDRLRTDLDTGVVISGGTRATLTSRDDQQFPLTVTNNLDEPVAVQLRFDTEFPQRLTVTATEKELTLQPGQSEQVRNEAVARTNGTFPVTGELWTRTEQRVGNRWEVQVSAADVSRIGWLIVIGSGVTLVGATAFRIRQVARERRGADA